MSFWTAMVVMTAIVAFTSMRMARWRAGFDDRILPRRGAVSGPILEALSAQTSQREKELQREVEDLRDRIAVLERIVTDDRHGKAIAEEIESLRDK
jgi:hypothetical protein